MDNGRQFGSQEFSLFIEEPGIEHQLAAIFNPQENGLVEVLE